jgi:N utilization substance protein B
MTERKTKMTNYTRSAEREKTMQALYQVFLFIENKEEFDATEVIDNEYGAKSIEEVPLFSKCVYTIALDKFDEIKETLSSHLVNWTFDRLDNVAKAILFEAMSEGKYAHLAPRKVVISQAVTLAKNYLKEGDHRFINAVLDKSIPEYEFTGK